MMDCFKGCIALLLYLGHLTAESQSRRAGWKRDARDDAELLQLLNLCIDRSQQSRYRPRRILVSRRRAPTQHSQSVLRNIPKVRISADLRVCQRRGAFVENNVAEMSKKIRAEHSQA